MAGRLTGKVIVVAGAGGIGSALVARFASEGAKVVVGDLDADAAYALAQQVDPGGETVLAIPLDGADEASVAAIVDLAMARFRRLDGFHANFAWMGDAQEKWGVVDMPLEAWDKSMAVNARGFVICTQKAVPAMIAGGGGTMLYTSSADAFLGGPVRLAYQMAKASIHALMRHTATRYGRKGVRANVIAPGLTLHEAQKARIPDETMAALKADAARRTALPGRFGTPEDIAGVAAMLMSDDGDYVTGQIVSVDGGLTMRG